ncbi:MAG TPA: hypothetical protein VK628_07745, partial [Flavitalea sp.]|nr:hypothetical protein [Flavitalea sp.]
VLSTHSSIYINTGHLIRGGLFLDDKTASIVLVVHLIVFLFRYCAVEDNQQQTFVREFEFECD